LNLAAPYQYLFYPVYRYQRKNWPSERATEFVIASFNTLLIFLNLLFLWEILDLAGRPACHYRPYRDWKLLEQSQWQDTANIYFGSITSDTKELSRSFRLSLIKEVCAASASSCTLY